MTRDEQFKILGIAPTYDAREIKRAYAKAAAGIHPEEQPEEWEKLHSAYKELLKTARTMPASPKKVVQSESPKPAPPVKETKKSEEYKPQPPVNETWKPDSPKKAPETAKTETTKKKPESETIVIPDELNPEEILGMDEYDLYCAGLLEGNRSVEEVKAAARERITKESEKEAGKKAEEAAEKAARIVAEKEAKRKQLDEMKKDIEEDAEEKARKLAKKTLEKSQPATDLYNEIYRKKVAEYEGSKKMESAISGIVAQSKVYSEKEKNVKELINLLKKVPSPHASFYGKTGINEEPLQEIRKHEQYFEALDFPVFLKQFEMIIKDCYYPEKIAGELLDDITRYKAYEPVGMGVRKKKVYEEEKNQNCERLTGILTKKIAEIKELTKDKLKGEFYKGKFLTWLFRDEYNLYDYVRYGGSYKVDKGMEYFIRKDVKGYPCDMVLDGVTYHVRIINNTHKMTYVVEELMTSDYDTPEDCLTACENISDFYERNYKKHSFTRFLRQFTILMLDLLLLVAIGFLGMTILLDFFHIGMVIALAVTVIDVAFKIATVAAYDNRKR